MARIPFLWLLLLGLLIRLPPLWHPVQEGQRNAQTACLTANMLEKGRLRMDPVAPWRGGLNARLVLELPAYNLLVLVLDSIPGVSLDLAGRLASLILWLFGFCLLQGLWRLALPQPAWVWANLLFVLAPMSWYMATAFMPETLVQLLTILFIFFALQHGLHPSAINAIALVLVATLGLLVKLPSFAYLGLFLGMVLLDQRGPRGFLHPVLLAGGVLIVSSLVAWSGFVEKVNLPYFPYWAGRENLIGFIQPRLSRLSATFWVKLAGYNLAYVIPPMAAPPAIWGFLQIWKDRNSSFFSRTWLYLAASLLVSALVWGKGPAAQNYYNLPNLLLFCALFGIGVAHWKQTSAFDFIPFPFRLSCFWIFVLTGVIWCVVGYGYLARPDTITLQAASWVRQNAQEGDLILYQPRHSSSVMDYEHQPLLSHSSGHRSWIWTRSTPEWEKQRAMETSTFLIVTLPPDHTDFWEVLRRKARCSAPAPPNSVATLYPDHFLIICSQKDFEVYRNTLPETLSH